MIIIGGLIYTPTFADPPGMPGNHGSNGDAPPGGGAPIDGGVFILATLAAAYGFSKKKARYTVVE